MDLSRLLIKSWNLLMLAGQLDHEILLSMEWNAEDCLKNWGWNQPPRSTVTKVARKLISTPTDWEELEMEEVAWDRELSE